MESFPYASGTWHKYKSKLKEVLATPARDPQRSGESPIGFATRMTKLLEVAGMGTRDAFLLTYDSFLVTSILAGLAPSTQMEVYKNFKTFDIPLAQFNEFLTLLSTADNIKGQRSKVQAVVSKKPKTPTKGRPTNPRDQNWPRCKKCGSGRHKTEQCGYCDYHTCNR